MTNLRKPSKTFYESSVFRRYKPFFWSTGQEKFLAFHTNRSAAYTDTDWIIWKRDKDGEEDGPLQGAVNLEAVVDSLSWNI